MNGGVKMTVWVEYVNGMYASGWCVSGEYFDGYIYDTPSPAEAVKAFENQFHVTVNEVIEK